MTSYRAGNFTFTFITIYPARKNTICFYDSIFQRSNCLSSWDPPIISCNERRTRRFAFRWSVNWYDFLVREQTLAALTERSTTNLRKLDSIQRDIVTPQTRNSHCGIYRLTWRNGKSYSRVISRAKRKAFLHRRRRRRAATLLGQTTRFPP